MGQVPKTTFCELLQRGLTRREYFPASPFCVGRRAWGEVVKMSTTSASRIVCSSLPFSEKERKEKRVPACNCLFCFLFTRSHLLRAWNRLSVEPEEKQGEIISRANIVCSTFIQFVYCSQSAIQRFWRVSPTNVKREGWNTPDALFIALNWRNHPRTSQKNHILFIYLKLTF